jgi:hypothetical protein
MLCVKGMSMMPTHASSARLKRPRYRAPGGNRCDGYLNASETRSFSDSLFGYNLAGK